MDLHLLGDRPVLVGARDEALLRGGHVTGVRAMTIDDVAGVVGLQRACFPPPFPEELLWSAAHLRRHLELFPAGQFVAVNTGRVVGSASNTRISRAVYDQHLPWAETIGGPLLDEFVVDGPVLYGLDISVHPDFRKKGIARRLYGARFKLVGTDSIQLYATACRLPGFAAWGAIDRLEEYLGLVKAGHVVDPTLSPLLRMGLFLVEGLRNYMEDEESHDCAALLEWRS